MWLKPTLLKKKRKFSPYIRQFRIEHCSILRAVMYKEGLPNIWGNAHIWLCNCSILNFLIFEENPIFFFFSSPIRKDGVSPMILKTTAHAQWNLKQTEHGQWTNMKKWLSCHYRVRLFKDSPNWSCMERKGDFSVYYYTHSLRISTKSEGRGIKVCMTTGRNP
jgi:hypothetical protein